MTAGQAPAEQSRWLRGQPQPALPFAVHETLRWSGGPPPAWSLHCARWQLGLRLAGWSAPPLEDLLAELRLPGDTDWRVRVMAFADGAVEATWRPLLADERTPAAWRLRVLGLAAHVPHALRGAKTTHLHVAHGSRATARQLGADEALLCTPAGAWAEATTANLLCGFHDGRLVTPDAAVLSGTTLAWLASRLPVETLPLSDACLPELRWAVLLNAVALVRPVAAIDAYALQPPPSSIDHLRALLARRPG